MTVTAHDLAVRLGLPANDTATDRAVSAALSWARKTLGLDAGDELDAVDDFGDDNWEAVAGYARDLLKLPKAAFGYFDGGGVDEGLAVAVGDIGRRWRAQLTYGVVGRARGFV